MKTKEYILKFREELDKITLSDLKNYPEIIEDLSLLKSYISDMLDIINIRKKMFIIKDGR